MKSAIVEESLLAFHFPRTKKRPASLFLTSLMSLCSLCPAAEPRQLPYPPSDILAGLEWTSEPHVYPGIVSDMHWHTWAADNSIYCIDGDGAFFGGKESFINLARITGTPLNHKIELVTNFRELDIRWKQTPQVMQRYGCGPVAVGTDLYVTLYDYDWRNPDNKIVEVNRYSKQGGIGGIILSRDGGKTWSDVPKKGAPQFLGPNYGCLDFIGFGPGYTGVPDELAGYVYAVSNDSNWASGDHMYLARVPRDKILDRSAWEFFSGKANAPEWSKSEDAAKPIFRDPGHVGHSGMTYNAPLKRYLLSVWSDTIPHSESATEAEVKTWDKQSELQMYEGPTPWGPWGLVYREDPWGGPDHSCYLPHLPGKWLGSDGLTGWMLYSGDWILDHHPKREYYGFVTRGFRLLPKSASN